MTTDKNVPFQVGQKVRVREEHRRNGDFDEAVVSDIDHEDRTVDVAVDGRDWGQWFFPLEDGSYEIEPMQEETP